MPVVNSLRVFLRSLYRLLSTNINIHFVKVRKHTIPNINTNISARVSLCKTKLRLRVYIFVYAA